MTKLRSRKLRVVAILTAVMLGVVMLLVPIISADNGALLIDPAGTCTYLGPNGSVMSTTDTRIVITYSSNGNVNYKCEDIVVNPGPALTYDFSSSGFNCQIPRFNEDGSPLLDDDEENPQQLFISTIDWRETISSSGNVTLTCRFNGFG
jgi:hypothetical protein